MNKLRLRNKILFQTKINFTNNIKYSNLKRKKWNFLKFLNNNPFKIKIFRQPDKLKKLYKIRLLSKQKLKHFYGCLNDYQIKNIFKKFNNKSNKLELFFYYFEKRLDTILFKLNIVSSIFEIKQLINHKNIYINNKIINISSYNLKLGDFIFIDVIKYNPNLIIFNLPTHLEYNKKLNLITLINEPEIKDVKNSFYNEFNLMFSSISK